MARDAVEEAFRGFSSKAQHGASQVTPASTTQNHLLVGAENYDPKQWEKLLETYGIEADICRHLASKYGNRANKVVNLTREQPELGERISARFPFLKAEIIYAVRYEMARTIRDFLARRIRLEILDWEAAKQAAPMVGHWMGQELDWSKSEKQGNILSYQNLLDSFIKRAQINE